MADRNWHPRTPHTPFAKPHRRVRHWLLIGGLSVGAVVFATVLWIAGELAVERLTAVVVS